MTSSHAHTSVRPISASTTSGRGARSVRTAAVAGCLLASLALAACGSTPAAAKVSGKPVSATTPPSGSPSVPNPYQYLPKVPSFDLSSTTVTNGQPLPADQMSALLKVPGGKDMSPQLTWSGFPSTTKSFVVSMYDPQAPTGSGFWHWVVADLPVTATSLPAGAGALHSKLPAPAFQLGADAGSPQYVGAAPPAGSGNHDYYLTVTALDVAVTGAGPTASAAYLGFGIGGHTVGRATIVCPTKAG